MKHIDDYTADRIIRAFTKAGCADTYLPKIEEGKYGVLDCYASNLMMMGGIRPTIGEVLNQIAKIGMSGKDHPEFGESLLRAYVFQLETMLDLEPLV